MDDLRPAEAVTGALTGRQRVCVLVLGMHRSGTSALARVLSIMGAGLPKGILGAGQSNESGHWEPEHLMSYDDQLIAELGSSWQDWRPLEFHKLPVRRREEIEAEIANLIAAEYGDAPLFVVKEPRICRFAPLFVAALSAADIDTRIVLAIRNPLEVAESLATRDAMPRGESYLLWLRHVLDAEAGTRDQPRVVIAYHDLLDDWRSAVSCVSEAFGLHWRYTTDDVAGTVEKFLVRDRRHHVFSIEDVLLDPRTNTWVSEAYEALVVLTQNPNSGVAQAILDRIKREFDKAIPVIWSVTRENAEREAKRAQAALEDAEAKFSHAEALADGQSGEIERFKREVGTLQEELDASRLALRANQEARDRTLLDIDLLQAEAAKSAAIVESTALLAAETSALAISALQDELSKRQIALQAIQEARDKSSADIELLKAEAVKSAARIESTAALAADKSALEIAALKDELSKNQIALEASQGARDQSLLDIETLQTEVTRSAETSALAITALQDELYKNQLALRANQEAQDKSLLDFDLLQSEVTESIVAMERSAREIEVLQEDLSNSQFALQASQEALAAARLDIDTLQTEATESVAIMEARNAKYRTVIKALGFSESAAETAEKNAREIAALQDELLRAISDRDTRIQELEALDAVRSEVLAMLETAYASSMADQRQAMLRDFGERIATVERDAATLRGECDRLQLRLSDAGAELQRQQQNLAEAGSELQRQEAIIAARTEEIAERDRLVEVTRRDLQHLRADASAMLSQRTQDIEAIHRELVQSRDFNDTLLGSLSWKITKPMRFLARTMPVLWLPVRRMFVRGRRS
jgi:hypothetical protein